MIETPYHYIGNSILFINTKSGQEFLKWLNEDCKNVFIEFARKVTRKQDIGDTKFIKKQQDDWQWYVWEEQGYDHLRILGFFSPEIASCVTMIRNRLEEFKSKDTQTKNVLDELKAMEEEKRNRRKH